MCHSALENHLFYGKCELCPVKETLIDKAKAMYYKKLQGDASAPFPTLEGMPLPPLTTAEAVITVRNNIGLVGKLEISYLFMINFVKL